MTLIRAQLIDEHMDHLQTAWDMLLPTVDENGDVRHQSQYCDECKLRWIGIMTEYLTIPQATRSRTQAPLPTLSPTPDTQDFHWSVNSLRGHLEEVQSKLATCFNCRGGAHAPQRGRPKKTRASSGTSGASATHTAPSLLLDDERVRSIIDKGFLRIKTRHARL